MATWRNLAIGALRLAGATNIAAALRPLTVALAQVVEGLPQFLAFAFRRQNGAFERQYPLP